MRLKKLTLTAVLTAAALVMFVLESQLPPLTAIPGIRHWPVLPVLQVSQWQQLVASVLD